jgi:hypothetical protein
MKDPTLEAALRFVRPSWLRRLWERYCRAVNYRPRATHFGPPRYRSSYPPEVNL